MGDEGYLRFCIKQIFKYGFGWYVLCLITGAAVAYGLTPMAYRYAGFELNRMYYIYENLHSTSQKLPEIVVLGDSVTMNGVDCRQLTEELKGHPVAWNLASSGLLVPEAMMIIEELPSSVKTIIFGVMLDMAVKPPPEFTFDRISAYKLSGFKVTDEMANVLAENGLKKTAIDMKRSYWVNIFEARTAILDSINTYCRQWLRKDLTLETALKDVFYPRTYAAHIPKDVLMMLADKNYMHWTSQMGRIDPANLKLYCFLGQMAREKGCRFIMLIMPERPLRKEWNEPDFYKNVNLSIKDFTAQTGFEVWDCKDLLPEEYFVDHVHPDPEGAKILTEFVGKKLNAQKE